MGERGIAPSKVEQSSNARTYARTQPKKKRNSQLLFDSPSRHRRISNFFLPSFPEIYTAFSRCPSKSTTSNNSLSFAGGKMQKVPSPHSTPSQFVFYKIDSLDFLMGNSC